DPREPDAGDGGDPGLRYRRGRQRPGDGDDAGRAGRDIRRPDVHDHHPGAVAHVALALERQCGRCRVHAHREWQQLRERLGRALERGRADVAAAGTPQVTVVTPTPGGGTSAAQTFTVNNPAPGLTGLTPTGATAGTGPLTLLVNGSGFVSGSTVRWNGAPRTTTFLSATQLTAAISAAHVTAAGTAQITVATPAPGGGTSGSMGFGITAASTVNVGLVGYWRFDEGSGTITGDASGGGNAGALINGPTWTTGRLGQALSFDGVGAYVQIGHTSSLDAYPLTVAFWMKTAATTGLTGILSKSVAGS